MGEMWHRFRLALEPLRHANKLGAILFQFPPWFYYRRSNLEYLARCAQMLEGYQLAIEFRNRTWFDEKHQTEVLAFERDHGLRMSWWTSHVYQHPVSLGGYVPGVSDLSAARAQRRDLGQKGTDGFLGAVRL
jgi:uncharacterized protein YecE (DUF72 family)